MCVYIYIYIYIYRNNQDQSLGILLNVHACLFCMTNHSSWFTVVVISSNVSGSIISVLIIVYDIHVSRVCKFETLVLAIAVLPRNQTQTTKLNWTSILIFMNYLLPTQAVILFDSDYRAIGCSDSLHERGLHLRCDAMRCDAMLCILCYSRLDYLYYIILDHDMLYYTILYYTMLCYAMLCYAILYYTLYYTIRYDTILY